MAVSSISQYLRPRTVSIFAVDPANLNAFHAFVLTNVALVSSKRVRLDLTKSMTVNRMVTAARSPVERAVADNIRLEPISFTISGSISANPLSTTTLGINPGLGAVGSLVRRDLSELAKLQGIQAARNPVTVVTPQGTFPSMAMSITESHTGSHKVDLTLQFQEVRIIDPLRAYGKTDLERIGVGSASGENVGGQSAQEIQAPLGVQGGLG